MDKHIRDQKILSSMICDGAPGVEELKSKFPGLVEDMRVLLSKQGDAIRNGDEKELKRISLWFLQKHAYETRRKLMEDDE